MIILGENDKSEKKIDIFKDMIKVEHVHRDLNLYHCKKCKIKFHNIQDLRIHVKKHFKDIWPLPKRQPFICPECFYEAHTYLSLFKHVGITHGQRKELQNSYQQSQNDQASQKRPRPEENQSLLQIQAKYPKKNFTIQLPPAEKPKVKFSRFISKLFKDTKPNDLKDESDDENEAPKDVIEANYHPPPQISCWKVNDNKDKAPHQWLCDGRLLMLEDPVHPNNQKMFQEQWIRGQPVVVCNSSELLNKHLWHPEAFKIDFGHLNHDLVNCLTGKTVPKTNLAHFWKGFQSIKHRLRDTSDTPMLLKLKDWPPTEDIANYMPKRFDDLVNSYPLHDYTHREGVFNLASFLPDFCLKPELGPKMYIAYGSALYSDKGSTNLHIDMSDAVNCLVYVGFPNDGDKKENAKEVFKEVDKAGCDIIMKRRIRSKNTLPGALWHVFHPTDTVKIRDFLNKVALEKGKRLDPHDDPIHDQSTYLDERLRRRLYQEYGVRGN